MLGITLEQAFSVFGRLCLPARAARGKNGVDLAGRFFLALHADDRQHAAGNIDAAQIALFHQRDRPADSGLGADVANDRAAACAGKAPVGDESYAGSERRVCADGLAGKNISGIPLPRGPS